MASPLDGGRNERHPGRDERKPTLDAPRAAEATYRAKDRFLTILSHELRTPLAPALLAASQIASDPSLPESVRKDAEMIRDNIRLETRLIDDLLDVNRIINNRLRLQLQSVDLNDAVLHVCGLYRIQFSEKKIGLHCDFDDQVGSIAADPARLQQIIWILLSNAAKFTPDGGAVHVTTARLPDGRMRVQVRDSGIGMSLDLLSHLFDPVEQADPLTRRFGGLGLGLTIAHALVEMHRGTIRAESCGEDRGSTFTIEFPADLSDQNATASMKRDDVSTPVRPLRILLVEDHSDTSLMLTRMLRMAGHHVSVGESVASALALAANQPFDLLVSDLGMPDGMGYDLMQTMKERYDTPGIAMSGYGTDDVLEKSREAGFGEHLLKPVDFEQLNEAILRLMRTRT